MNECIQLSFFLLSIWHVPDVTIKCENCVYQADWTNKISRLLKTYAAVT